MDVPHLDRDTYRQLLAGTLPPRSARALAEHLDRGCDACDAFLAALPPDALDGAVDGALTSLGAAAEVGSGHDLEFARVRRGVARGRRPRASRLLALAAAAALVAGVSVEVVRQRAASERAWDGEKGFSGIGVRLRFAVLEGGEGARRLDRGRDGAVVPSSVRLAFRAEVGGPASLALVRLGGGDREVVWRGSADRPGPLDVSEGGRAAAFPLRGLTGLQRFVLVASRRPLGDDELDAAARAAPEPAMAGPASSTEPVEIAAVEVTVR